MPKRIPQAPLTRRIGSAHIYPVQPHHHACNKMFMTVANKITTDHIEVILELVNDLYEQGRISASRARQQSLTASAVNQGSKLMFAT
jgi:hypothetical protein